MKYLKGTSVILMNKDIQASGNKDINFLQDIQALNWNLEFFDNNVNNMFSKFHSDLMKIVDDHITLKQLSRKTIKNMAKPWIIAGIRVSLRIKNNNIYKNKAIVLFLKI